MKVNLCLFFYKKAWKKIQAFFVPNKINVKQFVLIFLIVYGLILWGLYFSQNIYLFDLDIYYFSNVIGSISKRFLGDISVLLLIFLLFNICKNLFVKIFFLFSFFIILNINLFYIIYHIIVHSNPNFYIFHGFDWGIVKTYLNFTAIFCLILLLLLNLFIKISFFKIKDNLKHKKWLIVASISLIIIAYIVPIDYINYRSINNDGWKKKINKILVLEKTPLKLIFTELKTKFYQPKKILLHSEEKKFINNLRLEEKKTANLPYNFKKIILITVESLNQQFISFYNKNIPQTTPFIDSLLEKYPHLDQFYPSGQFTLYGKSAIYSSHTNLDLTIKNKNYDCFPELLLNNGFSTELIRGASKYYVGENVIFAKQGLRKVMAKEDFAIKYPDFIQKRPDLYHTWGYTDNYLFDEVIEKLKNASINDKLFLSVLTLDTHNPGGRCAFLKTEQDLDNPILYSVNCFDRVLQEFMKKLEEESLFSDDMLIILTADHLYTGYVGMEEINVQATFKMKPEKIPLIFISKKNINLKAKNGSQVDIAPTILDILNIEAPDYYLGKSLVSNENGIIVGDDGSNIYLVTNEQFYFFYRFSKQEEENILENLVRIKNIDMLNNHNYINYLIDFKNIDHSKNNNSILYKWYLDKYYN